MEQAALTSDTPQQTQQRSSAQEHPKGAQLRGWAAESFQCHEEHQLSVPHCLTRDQQAQMQIHLQKSLEILDSLGS